jgi:hypothetical protein
MATLQDVIHHFEVGAGTRSINRWLRFFACVVGLILLMGAYDLRVYRNFSTREAMDSAQVAHNLAQGQGFTTLFVRPLSIFLVQNQNQKRAGNTPGAAMQDSARLKGNHPDLANPPVYPLLLAGLMKVLPFDYAISSKPKRFWTVEGNFYRYQPDFLIALFNQALFFGLALVTFFLARRLFDSQVAWLSAIVLLGTELFWRFSASGLSTILLALIFMGLAWMLVLLEEEAREPKRGSTGVFVLAALAGLLVGLGGLTRYSFGWMILPTLLFVGLYTGPKRAMLTVTTFIGFTLVMTPWILRNVSLSGMPFGTSTFAIIENSGISPDDRLERSLNLNLFSGLHTPLPFFTAAAHVFWHKLVSNCRGIFQSDLPRLGGSWVSAFFLVGLLGHFRNPRLGRLRLFLLASLLVLTVSQALGRTKLSEDSPEINSENLLVLLAPLVMIYGVSLFYLVLEQMELPFFQFRPAAASLFAVIASLPLIFTILPPRTIPIVYPPYYPPGIQHAAIWIKEDELMMSDIPCAVAWYGQSQCVSLTLNARTDFLAINDYLKPISALYLTPQTIDRWTQAGDWGSLLLQIERILPGDNSNYPLKVNLTLPQRDRSIAFPLNYLQAGWPEQLLFTFRQKWPGSP